MPEGPEVESNDAVKDGPVKHMEGLEVENKVPARDVPLKPQRSQGLQKTLFVLALITLTVFLGISLLRRGDGPGDGAATQPTSDAASTEETPMAGLTGQAVSKCCKTDFSGSWVLRALDCSQAQKARRLGDPKWDEFLVEQQYGWAKRKVMAAAHYGVGKLKETVSQECVDDGCRLIISSKSALASSDNDYVVNGKKQDGQNPKGDVIGLVPTWEGTTLVTVVKNMKTDKEEIVMRRTMPTPDSICVKMVSGNGIHVERLFKRN
jgi:hypothetical protein